MGGDAGEEAELVEDFVLGVEAGVPGPAPAHEDADDSGEATSPLSLTQRPPWRAHRRQAHGAGSVMFAGRKLEGEKGRSGSGNMGEKGGG
jgi:hypothetical protein